MRTKIVLFLILGVSLLLTACGSPTSLAARSLATPGSSSGTPIVVKSVTPGASASPSAPTSPTSTPVSGPVTVQTSASLYQPEDPIVVTISNHTPQSIFFPNHQTDCTVVLLQHQVGSTWEPIAVCKEMIVTIIQTLSGEKSLVISLRAGLAPWPAGSYRVAFHYLAHASGDIKAAQEIFSPLFQVR